MPLRGIFRILSLQGLLFLLVGLYLLMEFAGAALGLGLAMPLTGSRDMETVQEILFQPGDEDLADPAVLLAIKMINICVSFGKLLAGLFFLSLAAGHPVAELGTDRKPLPLMMLLAVLGMVFASPLIDFLNTWNQGWPDGNTWMQRARELEEQAARLTLALTRPASPLENITTFLMVAVLAAAWEELIFRGILQRLIEAFSRNAHLAVWATALIFSAIHFQFFSSVPRLVLGVVLGYLFVWSRNLWVPMLAHFVNNAAYLAYSWIAGPEKAAETGDTTWPWALAGLAGLGLCLYGLYRMRDREGLKPWEGLDPQTKRLPFEPPRDSDQGGAA
jgi:membrane protease YdiL (CAAX protease family)